MSKKIECKFHITFEPKEDISTYELARCLKFYVLILFHKGYEAETYKKLFENLPQEIQRHFSVNYEG